MRGDDTGVVYIHDGEVTFASLRAGDTLGEALVGSGLLAADTWRTVIEEADERPLGEALVWSGALDADRLRAFLQHHVEESLFDQLRWSQGEFQFRVGEDHPLGHAFSFDVATLLTQVEARVELWNAIVQRIPSVDAVVDKVRTLPAGHNEVTLTADEWRLVVAVDGRRSVSELARSLGQGTFQTCYALHGLVEAELVELVDATAEVVPVVNASPAASGRNAILQELAARLEQNHADPAPPDEDVDPAAATADGDLAAALSPTVGLPPRPDVTPLRRLPNAVPLGMAVGNGDELPDRNLVRRLLTAVKEL